MTVLQPSRKMLTPAEAKQHPLTISKIGGQDYVEHLDSPLGSVTLWAELRIAVGKP